QASPELSFTTRAEIYEGGAVSASCVVRLRDWELKKLSEEKWLVVACSDAPAGAPRQRPAPKANPSPTCRRAVPSDGVAWPLGQPIECHEAREQRLHLLERHHVGTVGGRAVGILVRLDEHAGDADRDGGARQHRYELALAARRGALPARLL